MPEVPPSIFSPDKPLPAALVTKLVGERIAEERETSEKASLEGCSSCLAALGQILLQDTPFGSVPVGSEPQLDDLDALLTAYSLGLDKLPLPYLSGGVPALLARPSQLSTLVVVVCPIVDPTPGCRGCRFSMSDGMMTSHSSSPFATSDTPV